ncbi:MAG: hypothetical protein M3352_00435 [Bacteroidota bacterium]|nr:hypothetical protein [Bacteroidota bacterium]
MGRKNERGHYDYRSPQDEDFTQCLVYNWLEKWTAVHGKEVWKDQSALSMLVKFYSHPPQQRLITIKSGTAAQTKIRGYTKFQLQVQAPKELLEMAMGAGLGLHNAQGMGCVGVVEKG